MKTFKYTVAALAVIAAASFTQSAMAQSASTGDLIFGVYDANTSSSTVATSYELDLGSFNKLSSGETFDLGTTVSSLFSSDSSASLLYDIGASGGPLGAGGLLRKEVAVTAETLPSPLPTNNTTEYGALDTEYAAFSAGTVITLPSGTSSTGTALTAVTLPNSTTGSFEESIVQGGTDGYGYGAGLEDAYPSTDSVAFYVIPNGTAGTTPETAVADGTFTLSNVNGSEYLTYNAQTVAAVPEPSTYALVLGGAALLWVLKRRRSVA